MTSASRRMLAKCEKTREALEDEPDDSAWNKLWNEAVDDLQSIANELQNSDVPSGHCDSNALNQLKATWRKDDIYRHFISVKKAKELMSFGPVPVAATMKSLDGISVLHQGAIDENIYRPLTSGFFEGEDGRTVLDLAIEWWDEQLAKLGC